MEAKTWFRWTKELEKGGDKVVWKPEEVRLDMHDNEKFNRIFTKSDHTLVIKDFRPCKLQLWIRFYFFVLEKKYGKCLFECSFLLCECHIIF